LPCGGIALKFSLRPDFQTLPTQPRHSSTANNAMGLSLADPPEIDNYQFYELSLLTVALWAEAGKFH
jgi:hypothetical protein